MSAVKAVTIYKSNPYPREKDIIKWSTDRNIYENSTQFSQFGKLEEEVEELLEGIENKDREAKKDAIGDCYVVLTNIAHMSGLTMEECVEFAWQSIKDRKGRMQKGVFVKES